ncbi:S-layer homology domain-containing protein [Cohnella terricola]|uniref:Ig domain-containing protein group 2 domain-containing protein n=1 Tax=Cohnella terricola TaxID=1289167 RepID=A0A559J9I2_9BACL|nr:S-layer homology domain-containing protein [Cohnella terricola]TVX96512.1 Ig domain-containing protein group 2 domain-containing protein [Cohnella terricola]
MIRWMMRSKKGIALLLAMAVVAGIFFPNGWNAKTAAAGARETIAKWDGAGTGTGADLVVPTSDAGPSGMNAGRKVTVSGAKITGFNAGPSGVNVVNSNTWADNAYWEISFVTTGYEDIQISSKQYSSSTGPKSFKLQYSLDEASWTDVTNGAITVGSASWTSGGKLADAQLPDETNDRQMVYVRWLMLDTGVATTGASRIADIEVTGSPLGGSTLPPSDQSKKPETSKIRFLDDYQSVVGVTGAVYGGATVNVYYQDNSLASSTKAEADGSFQVTVGNPARNTSLWVSSTEGSKQESERVTVSIPKSGAPVANKITFANSVEVAGASGAVAGRAEVTVYFDDNSVAGTTTAETNGSFQLNVANPGNKTAVYIEAKEDGKLVSDKTMVVMAVQNGKFKPGDVVINQIYVNGGNSGAFYKSKFFELYNTTDHDISFNNQWAIIYASSTATSFGSGTKLDGTIKAHGYYLIQGSSGAVGLDLPIKPDVTTTINPSGSTGGILALASSTTGLTGQDDPNAIDIVVFGNGSNKNFALKTDRWGSPFYSETIGGGTMLRKTAVGSNAKASFGLGAGFFSKNPANDFMMNAPSNSNNPEEVAIRSTKSMLSPDASKITFGHASGRGAATGQAGSVPGSSTVKAYLESGGVISLAEQATALADGSFALDFADASGSANVYVTFTDSSQPVVKESAYARVDESPNANAITPIGQLRKNDANGFPLHVGYKTTIEGIVTTNNKTLGNENTSFYIQDATGGISVIGGLAPTVAVAPGNKVKVTGTIAFTAGTLQFVPTSMTDSGADTVPVAASVSPGSLGDYASAEPLEGKLVSFKAKVTNIPSTGPDYNITVTDGSEPTIVRVLSSSGIDVAGGAISLNETYLFTGIVAQSKSASPYTSGYYLMPRGVSDIKGDLQLKHTRLAKAYVDVDVSFKATAKNADSVALYYNFDGGSAYAAIPMLSADQLNYNAQIPKTTVGTHKNIYYYIESVSGTDTASEGDAAHPIAIPVVEDHDGPEYGNMTPFDGEEIESKHPVISVSMDDPNGVDVTSVNIKVGTVDFTSKAEISASEIRLALTPSDDLDEGKHVVTVTAKDKLGNVSTGSWSFTVLPRFSGGNHYYGTTHNHTNISHDADGAPEDALKAAQKHDYDWFAFSDHSHDIDSGVRGTDTVDHNGMKERSGGADWQLTKNLAKQYTKNGKFVVFPAFEMTSTTWGHSNVFGTSNFIDRVQEGGQYQKLQTYYAWVLTYDNIVAQFNHPAMSANAFDNFIPYDKKVDKLFTMLEVGNGSGKYSYANAENKLFSALDLGWHVAPTYGEDNHDATWGQTKQRTVIVANDLSQDSLFEAMRKRHVYFTEDPNAKLDVSASGWYMGSVTDTKTLNFNVQFSDSVWEEKSDPKYSFMKTTTNDNIAKAELVTNGGRVVSTYIPSGDKTSITSANWNPTFTVIGGQQWFVVRITQKDGDRIYSAPIWSPVESVSAKVSHVTAADGAFVGGVAATVQAGISNLGAVDLKDITATFYYDQEDSGHLIGEATVASLKVAESLTTSVVWSNPVPGNHKIVVVLSSTAVDLGINKYEQTFQIKAPLDKTILIDASKGNENTSKDNGTYKENFKLFTVMMRQQGYTVAENVSAITDNVLAKVSILYMSHPASAYSASEIAAINRFVEGGGSLLLTEKSNFGGSNQNLNPVLSGIGSSILMNDDGVFDETKDGNFWSTPLTSNFSVRAHPTPVVNGLTDFVPTIEYYSGSSLARNDGSGNKTVLTDSDSVTLLVRGNESTFQDSTSIKAGTASYNVYTSKKPNGPALTDVTGGSSIPMIASETIGTNGGRIVVSGMNVFNDKQMDQTFNPKGNDPFALNVINWLAHLEPKVIKIGEARKLPEGTSVVVQGTVTTAVNVFFDAAYVQDETGGIMAFNEIPEGSLKEGDIIRVYGHIKTFENNKEVEFDKFDNSIVKLGSGTPLEPKKVSTAESVSDAYQGQLVKVAGKVTSIPDGNSFIVNDGSGNVLVSADGYIVNQSGKLPDARVGDTLEAVGLSGKFSEGDRIRVRDTKELKILAKAGDGDPSDGNNGGGNNGGGDNGGGQSEEKPGTVTVTPDLIKEGANGKKIIEVSSKTEQIRLPADIAELLSKNAFEVKSDHIVLEIRPEVIKQLIVKVTAEEWKSGSIVIAISPVSASLAKELIAKGENSAHATIKASGDIYELDITVTTANGKSYRLTQLDKPITIRLKVGANTNPNLASIFYISDSGTLEYIGGKYSNGEMTAQISHLSKYAVLEVTKAYRDVPNKYWAYEVIQELAAKQIINGTSATTFEPNRSITRAEFTALLVNALKLDKTSSHVFSDVAADKWYASPISIAYEAGIVTGKSAKNFDPSGLIKREEMVTMLMKAYETMKGQKLGTYSGTPFKDMGSVSPWAANWVRAAAELGLVHGRTATTFVPGGITTRAEAAQVIYNLIRNE